MFSQRIRKVMQGERMLVAPSGTTVQRAAQLMAEGGMGAVLVVDDERLVGIFTERDAVFRVIARGLDAATTTLAEVMTASPYTISPELSFGQALQLMHQHRIRHVPVVEGGKPVGIVSGRDALDPEMEEFAVEAQRRESFEASAAVLPRS
jgi:CBS domain-containing protein